MHKVSLNCPKRHHLKLTSFFVTNNKLFIVLSIVLLVGVFCGSILVKFFDKNTFSLIGTLLVQDLIERGSESFLNIFIASISAVSIFILPAFLMGLSAWGYLLAPLVPFTRGLCIGLASGYIYLSYGLKGMGFYALVFLPGIFTSVFAVLLVTQEAILFSKHYVSMIFSKNVTFGNPTKRYILKISLALFLVIVSGGVDVFFSLIFSNLFVIG